MFAKVLIRKARTLFPNNVYLQKKWVRVRLANPALSPRVGLCAAAPKQPVMFARYYPTR